MTPEDLGRPTFVSDPRLHPDGRTVAFVTTRIDLEKDRYERRIWIWVGERARRFTAGPGDAAPRWSPDGSRLAFLRTGPGDEDRPQLAVMPRDGGEPEVVTDFPLGVTELEWSPDGSRIAVVAAEWTEEWAGLEDDERSRVPRRITRVPARFDSHGWIHDRRSHVWLVDPDGEDPVCLTPGDFDEAGISWHPDGSSLTFTSARHPERGLDPGSQIWRVAATGGDAEALTDVGFWHGATHRPDGAIHLIGLPDRWGFPDVIPLLRVESDGTTTDLTGHLDRNLFTLAPPLAPAGPQWLSDGSCLSTLEDQGAVRIVRIAPDGSVESVLDGDRAITGCSPRPDGSAFAFTATSPTEPSELWWWEDGEERRLTGFNDDLGVAFVAPEAFSFDHDGTTVHGWVYLPPGEDRVPLLLNIHGGPASQYPWAFFDEFQVYVAAGYGVVATNPRGSTGYGANHVRAVVGTWGAEGVPPDERDLLAAIDAALEQFPRLDPDRVGVMGGSYGGMMTARLIAAAPGRFRSAVAERGLYSWISFAGSSDIGGYFDQIYLAGRLPADVDTLWRASPVARVAATSTPTLVVHSEADFRCPIEQGEQLFTMLLRHGVTTEMLRFPGESHELSRSGKPKHRVERFHAILDWHARHLR